MKTSHVTAEKVVEDIDKSKKPNIVLILTDDQSWIDLSEPLDPDYPDAYCNYFHTPRINQLAKEGMRFTDAYSPAPICTPTRRSIQFGMTPARQHGTEFLGDFDPTGKWSIAHAMKNADSDYKCAHFGKWGEVITGTFEDKNSQIPGFPENFGYDLTDGPTGNIDGDPIGGRIVDNITIEGLIKGRMKKLVTVEHEDPKLTFSINARAKSFMEQMSREQKPFFMQVSYYAVHLGNQALKETIEKYQNKSVPKRKIMPGTGPMLEDMDTAIGELLDFIDELGIQENTYVFLMSDNGGQDTRDFWETAVWLRTIPYQAEESNFWKLPMDYKFERNHPLRMSKQTLYEGGIRVPFIVKGPGIEAGTICREPVVGYDLLPTFYELAGGEKPLPQIDGGSLCGLLANRGHGKVERPVDGLIFHRPNFDRGIKGHSAFRQGDYKLVLFWTNDRKVKGTELYNLRRDIGEQNDLSKQMPEKVRALQSKLLGYLEEVGD